MRPIILLLLVAASAGAQTSPPTDIEWTWEPGPRWLQGIRTGSPAPFEGGLSFDRYFGTSVAPSDVPPIRIVFDADLETVTRSFDVSNGFADLGPALFRGAAYDLSNPDAPRRLNVGITEDPRHAPPDFLWAPDASPRGGNELLIVFSSDYDEADSYGGRSGANRDVYVELYAREGPGRGLYSTAAALTVTPAPLRDVRATGTLGGQASVHWTAARHTQADALHVRLGGVVVATADPREGVLRVRNLTPDQPSALTLDLVDAAGSVIASRPVLARPAQAQGIASASVLTPVSAPRYGDVWGYTAPDGTEYALLTARNDGLFVIDITAAPQSLPVEVAFVPSPATAGDAKDVKVFGHHAYLAHETGPLSIIDLSDPENAVEVGVLDVQPDVLGGGAHNVFVAEGHLWVVGGSSSGNAGLRVFSLADPANPTFVGSFRPDHQTVPYYHDIEVRDGRAYGAAIYSGGGVDVLDVSDPADIRLITTFTYPGAGAHNTCTSEDGQTVYVGDEIGTSGNWMRIFDVTDIQNAELVGEIIVDEAATVHNCVVRGDRMYVAHYAEGLRVFDVSMPHDPVEMAWLDTVADGVDGLRGAWTAYPFSGSGKIILSDLSTGLWVTELGDLDTSTPLPPGLRLQTWPNPARGATRLVYHLDAEVDVRLVLLDVQGREVAVVADGRQASGAHLPIVDVSGLPAGRYLAVLTADGERLATAPVTIVR